MVRGGLLHHGGRDPIHNQNPPNNNNHNHNNQHQQHSWKLSRWYCWFSAAGAALAIVTAGGGGTVTAGGGAAAAAESSSGNNKYYHDDSNKYGTAAAANPNSSSSKNFLASSPSNTQQQPNSNGGGVCWWDPLALWDGCKPSSPAEATASPPLSSWNSEHDGDHKNSNNNNPWWRFLLPFHQKEQAERLALQQRKQQEAQRSRWWWRWSGSGSSSLWVARRRRWLLSWLDPRLLHPTADTATAVIDKVLTSTARLLLIANWLLALTVLLHAAVADWFLGDWNRQQQTQQQQQQQQQRRPPVTAADPNNNNNNNVNQPPPPPQPLRNAVPSSGGSAATSRERMGGFLVFKLLLISAVVTPDTLDVLILLSWYTVLSFLRSLASLGAQHTEQAQQQQQQTNNNNNHQNNNAQQQQQFQQQHSGVWKLLAFCLCMDCSAAAVCVGLFHGAGTGMVLLLTCDCALLGVDCVLNLVQYWQWVWEWQHADRLEQLEEEQDRLLATLQRQNSSSSSSSRRTRRHSSPLEEVKEEEGHEDEDSELSASAAAPSSIDASEAEELSRELDRRMELLEEKHSTRTAWLESAIFALQLLTDLLTIAHFLHIWSLHGVQLTLIDGVLALHLHSAVQSASKKILERRQLYKIARDMHGAFADASDLDLRKAAAAGDVCCICLGTMSYYHSNAFQFCSATGSPLSATASPSNTSSSSGSSQGSKSSNVKKVACGHLYHANCLREVIERARSMEAARCPLCRSSIVHGPNHTRNSNNSSSNNANATTAARDGDDAVPAPAGDERALFRFSTENMFPVWMPLPAFSFEVVRRPANLVNAAAAAPGNDAAAAGNANNNNNAARNNNVNDNNNNNNNNAAAHQQTFLRRLLLLSGVVQMTAEEERVALEQLVDMFPQYDRQDLVAALRQRGSAEAVAETILLGSFGAAARER